MKQNWWNEIRQKTTQIQLKITSETTVKMLQEAIQKSQRILVISHELTSWNRLGPNAPERTVQGQKRLRSQPEDRRKKTSNVSITRAVRSSTHIHTTSIYTETKRGENKLSVRHAAVLVGDGRMVWQRRTAILWRTVLAVPDYRIAGEMNVITFSRRTPGCRICWRGDVETSRQSTIEIFRSYQCLLFIYESGFDLVKFFYSPSRSIIQTNPSPFLTYARTNNLHGTMECYINRKHTD